MCLDYRRFFKNIIIRFKKKFKNYQNRLSYDYLVLAGKADLDNVLTKNAKKIIKGQSLDYDIFLKLRNKNITTELKSYAVF